MEGHLRAAAESPCRVQRTERIFPLNAPTGVTITKLSIVDATVARFGPCAAVWFYNRTEKANANDPVVFERLEEALRRTLNDYPHYSGQLLWAPKELVEGAAKTYHYGRPIVIYGAPEDPGVELVIAEDNRELSALVPSREERSTVKQVWNATEFPQNDFLSKTQLAFSKLGEFEGLPGVSIQLTAFKCGGFAIGAKFTHCLSDALCLMQFAHVWAGYSQLLFGGSVTEKRSPPVFNPSLLDQYANLTTKGPDPELIRKARALPMHRYDWWATDAPGYPDWPTASSNATKPPPEELAHIELSPSTFPPWPTWDLTAPIEHVQIRFKAEAIAKMKRAVEMTLPECLKGQRISRLDAALAHIFILMNRARQYDNDHDEVYIDAALGLRNRVSPPLPDTFVGSPMMIGYVAMTGSEATTATIGLVAGLIREMTSRFTPDAVTAYLHDAAYEVCPQRFWQAFVGSRHMLVTSWIRAGAYEVDFCATRQLARYVQGIMPRMDGLVQVIDVGETGDFDISVGLEKETCQRFIQDHMLKAYGI
ncbi:transferase family protein [Hypomontagnella submonticulosa]|nr:transferase family protein [Hypomontagnella submonticulosa]